MPWKGVCDVDYSFTREPRSWRPARSLYRTRDTARSPLQFPPFLVRSEREATSVKRQAAVDI